MVRTDMYRDPDDTMLYRPVGVVEMAKEEQLPGMPEKVSKTWRLGESLGYMTAMQRRCSVPANVVAFWDAAQLADFHNGYEAGYSRGREAQAVQS